MPFYPKLKRTVHNVNDRMASLVQRSSWDDILLLSSKLYDIVLVWTDRRWRGNSTWQQQVLPKFLYISAPAQPLESHRFSGDEKTRLQTWHLRSSGPTSALIFSGNATPMSPVYSIYAPATGDMRRCDRWPDASAVFRVLQLCCSRWVCHGPQTSGK